MSRHQSDRSAVDNEEEVDRYQDPDHHFVAIEGSFGALRKHRSSDLNVRPLMFEVQRPDLQWSQLVMAKRRKDRKSKMVEITEFCAKPSLSRHGSMCLPIGFRVHRPVSSIFPSSFAMPRLCLSVGIEDHG
jgi:hypothetical protein